MLARCFLAFLFSAMSFALAQGQLTVSVTAPASPIITVPFQQKALLAFSPLGKIPVTVAVVGTASWTSGAQHDTGTLELKASADGSISENWSFSTISHTQTHSALGSARRCFRSSADGTQHEFLGPNCLQAVPWFFPGFVFQPVYSAVARVADSTATSDSSNGIDKLTYAPTLPAVAGATPAILKTIARLEKATAISVEYDAQTALPKRVVYRQAIDTNELRTVEVAIVFGNYSAEAGLIVPHHIQRYVQGSLQVDLNVTGVTIQ